MTADQAKPDAAARRTARRTERARELARDQLSLGYMQESGELDLARDDPFPSAVQRYLIYHSTDGGDDGWVDFAVDWAGVADRLRNFIDDEWGLVSVFDLDRRAYRKPLEFTYRVVLSRPT